MQPILSSPSAICGSLRLAKVPLAGKTAICAGAPDSFAAALGSGALVAGDRMIYLGTFGSLLEVTEDLEPLILAAPLPRHPYRWRISVPGFGAAVERHARVKFPSDSLQNSLGMLDLHATLVRAGARGLLFHLPTWDTLGIEHGSLGFVGWHGKGVPPRSVEARAVLESLGYLIRTKLGAKELASAKFRVAGGGAASGIWRGVLADVLGCRVTSPSYSAGVLGAAAIAGASVGWKLSALLANAGTEAAVPNPRAYLHTHRTADRASSWYAKQGISNHTRRAWLGVK